MVILKQAFDTSNLEGNALSWVLELSKILHAYSAIEKNQGEWYIFEPVEMIFKSGTISKGHR